MPTVRIVKDVRVRVTVEFEGDEESIEDLCEDVYAAMQDVEVDVSLDEVESKWIKWDDSRELRVKQRIVDIWFDNNGYEIEGQG